MSNTITTKLKGITSGAMAEFENVAPIKVVAKSLLEKHQGAWSPVHMLVSSVETCFFVTLLAIAEKAHVEIKAYESSAEAEMGLKDGKHSAITSITIRPKVELADENDRQKLPNLFKKAEEYCTVGNSLNFTARILI